MTAALFAARYGYRTALVEKLMGGGQIINAEHIENYPGFPQGTSGYELGPMMQEQADNAGAQFLMAEVSAVRSDGPYHVVATTEGELRCKAVIIAGGSSLRKLGVPGEEECQGRGVSYCASCDGPFFQDQVVGVVGGGDSAMDEALTLTQYASRVLVFHHSHAFRAQKVLQDRVLANPKIEVRWNTVVEEILPADSGLRGVKVRDALSGETSQVELSGLFIFIGLDPNTAYLKGILSMDEGGHIATDIWMATEKPGIFAAGDIRQNSAAQVVTSAGDGATAATAAHRYIKGRRWQ
ncbi:MAG: FAD-dependent oxidoreductase [Chloroflexi bacterium]|nr:FAD-dependent oxidoreductase [Chloroflexota bacterium]